MTALAAFVTTAAGGVSWVLRYLIFRLLWRTTGPVGVVILVAAVVLIPVILRRRRGGLR